MAKSLSHTKWMRKYHYRVHAEVQEKDHLQPVQRERRANPERPVQMEGMRNYHLTPAEADLLRSGERGRKVKVWLWLSEFRSQNAGSLAHRWVA